MFPIQHGMKGRASAPTLEGMDSDDESQATTSGSQRPRTASSQGQRGRLDSDPRSGGTSGFRGLKHHEGRFERQNSRSHFEAMDLYNDIEAQDGFSMGMERIEQPVGKVRLEMGRPAMSHHGIGRSGIGRPGGTEQGFGGRMGVPDMFGDDDLDSMFSGDVMGSPRIGSPGMDSLG